MTGIEADGEHVSGPTMVDIGRVGNLMGRADAAFDLLLTFNQPNFADEADFYEWTVAHRQPCRKAFVGSELWQRLDAAQRAAFQFAWERGEGAESGVDPLDFAQP